MGIFRSGIFISSACLRILVTRPTIDTVSFTNDFFFSGPGQGRSLQPRFEHAGAPQRVVQISNVKIFDRQKNFGYELLVAAPVNLARSLAQ